MTTLSKQYTFSSGAVAESAKVNVNFDDIINYVNGSVVLKDASVAMTGILTLPNSDPTTNNHAARKKYVDDKVAAVTTSTLSAIAQGSTSSAVVGTLAGGEHFKMSVGYNVGSVDGSGDLSVVLSPAFANGVVSVQVTPLVGGGTINVLQRAFAVSAITGSSFKVRSYNPSTGVSDTTGSIGVLWVAVGW